MTDSRRSMLDPCPPPQPSPDYDANQRDVQRLTCRGCSKRFDVPRHLREPYVCAGCRGKVGM